MLIYSIFFIGGSKFLSSTTLCKLLKSFTMPNLRKLEITIDFKGNLGHFLDVITGQARLIQSHSSARFCFKSSGNLN